MNEKLIKYFNGDELAASVFLSKYAKDEHETPNQMHDRLAKEFARIELKYDPDSHLNEERIRELFDGFKKVIPQGSVMSQLGVGGLGSLSNCFVVDSPYDSYGGIFRTDQELGQLMKRRCGVGVDVSTLRPEGEVTQNVSKTSTGVCSFLNRFSSTTREVAQGGRRGALMLSIDINHPDVADFITIKKDLTKVTGANISVRVNNKFMKAAQADEDYYLQYPCDAYLDDWIEEEGDLEYNVNRKLKNGAVIKKIRAKELWDLMMEAAHKSAEPGILFWDEILSGPDGVYPHARPISTNPCGEIPIPANDSCRLMAINLTGYVKNKYKKDAYFDFPEFDEDVYDALRLNDNLVDLEIEHIGRILEKIRKDPEPEDIKQVEIDLWKAALATGKESRRTGLGITGLGDCLAQLGYSYGDISSTLMTDKIMHYKMKAELHSTIDMAKERGYFEGWNLNNEYYREKDGNKINVKGRNSFYEMILEEFPNEAAQMMLYGRRNISWSTIAPTGSLSMLAQVTSGGEPAFSLWYMRRVKINANDPNPPKPDFVDENGDEFTEHAVLHEEFKNWINHLRKEARLDPIDVATITKAELEGHFKHSPWYGATAPELSAKSRVVMQSTLQRYTTHSISSTVNLSRDTPVKHVNDIYMHAWENKLKGITVYREGSRDGILVSDEVSQRNNSHEYTNAKVKRPKSVHTEARVVKIGGVSHSVFVGLVDGIPYELFCYEGGTRQGKGTVEKKGKGEYYFIPEEGGKDRIITGKMSPEQSVITRLISGSLRHGRNVSFIIEDLEKEEGHMFSFNHAIAKVLKSFVKEEDYSFTCNDCNSKNVVFEEGCNKCLDCGSSACS